MLIVAELMSDGQIDRLKNFRHGVEMKIGDKVRVVAGSYVYTKVGSEGVITDLGRFGGYNNQARVEFYKLTGKPPFGSTIYSVDLRNLAVIFSDEGSVDVPSALRSKIENKIESRKTTRRFLRPVKEV